MGKFKLKQVYIHIVLWAAFIFYEGTFFSVVTGRELLISDIIGHYALNISLFYFHAFVAVPLANIRSSINYKVLIPVVVLELICYIVLKYALMKGLMAFVGITNHPYISFKLLLMDGIWRGINFIGFSSVFLISQNYIQQRKNFRRLQRTKWNSELENNRLQKNIVEYQNAYLLAQINPHLLFNTLNFLYSTVSPLSEKASSAILLLSDTMRYALNPVGPDGKVLLIEEIEHLKNIVEINQIRYDHKLFLDFQVKGYSNELRIIPLLLLTLVENVFKYGNLSDDEYPARIHLETEGHTLHFLTSNQKRKSQLLGGHGIGISNVSKRLEAYYPGKYTLDVINNDVEFLIDLRLELS